MPTRTDAERIEAVLTGRDPVTGETCDRLDPNAFTTDRDEWFLVCQVYSGTGGDYSTFDAWSRTDGRTDAKGQPRYNEAGNRRAWDSCKADATPGVDATMGSFVRLCKSHGVKVPNSGGMIVPGAGRKWTTRLVDGRPEIVYLDEAPGSTTRPRPAEERELTPVQMCREQVAALFEPGEQVGLENSNAEGAPDGRTRFIERDRLLGVLDAADAEGKTDLADALGSLSPRGAFLCVAPLDGNGRKAENVTAYRHILCEGDESPVADQLACLKRLGLPCSTVTFSGNKSVHALVRVDAANADEYRERFRTVAALCEAEGIKLDPQCKNPNRLTRLAGAVRDGELQGLESVDPGASWNRYVADTLAEAARGKAEKAKGSTLPMPTDLSDGWGEDRRAPDLIGGMLRCGQLGMMAGPSKAGKSWAAIQLAVAVATGGRWLDRQCKQGRVLYVDYELAPESSDRRVWEVAQAAWGLQHDLDRGGFDALVKANVRPLHLRGTFKPTEQYAAHIKAVCEATGPYDLIIVDPFYRFSDADENSAKETGGVMAMGYGIVDATGAAVMIVHHYPKGKPGQKDALDRMSGSGVLTRSPDCLLDFAPLDDDVGDPDLAVVLNGKVAVEVTPNVRDHPPVKPFRVIRDHPLMLPTDNEAVAKLDVKGANRPAESKRKAAKAKARDMEREERAYQAAWDNSEADRFTTADGVHVVSLMRWNDVLDHSPETGLPYSIDTIKNHLGMSEAFTLCHCSELGVDHKEHGWKNGAALLVCLKSEVNDRAQRLKAEREAAGDG